MEIILFEPEIPPNTGNVARLCAATGVPLHLIEPLGFSIDDKHLKRAGLDYWPAVNLNVWPDWKAFRNKWNGPRLVLTSARQGISLQNFDFRPEDGLVFGPETRGCPDWLIEENDYRVVNIPMADSIVRSLNLSTAAGIVLYEALRKIGQLDVWAQENVIRS